MSPFFVPEIVLRLAGLGQLVLALGSLAIPAVLHWREDVARLRPLTRQVFSVYACILTGPWRSPRCRFLAPGLNDRSLLAACVTGFIALWWATRLTIQFTMSGPAQRAEACSSAWPRRAWSRCLCASRSVYGLASFSNLAMNPVLASPTATILWSLTALLPRCSPSALGSRGCAGTRWLAWRPGRLSSWLFSPSNGSPPAKGPACRMLAIVAVLLWSLKAVVTVEEQAAGEAQPRPDKLVAVRLSAGLACGPRFAAAPGALLAGGCGS